jgi:citrate lyase subunit beta/citryl-CoA lyase
MDSVRAVPRSSLSVPGSSPRMLAKSLDSAADEIVFDLEDAVAAAAKDDARAAVVDLLAGGLPRQQIAVRINAVGTPWCHADLIAFGGLKNPPATVILPKVESAGDIAFVERLLAGVTGDAVRRGIIGHGIKVQALIESAAGLVAVDEIARAGASLDALILGYADLSASLGREPGAVSWDSARERLLWAARANGLRAVDGPHLGIAVDDAFRAGLDLAARTGFDGKWVIHPSQIAAVNDAFSPDAKQIDWAERVLAALQAGQEQGLGAVALDGAMLDEAIAVRARRVLARSGASR